MSIFITMRCVTSSHWRPQHPSQSNRNCCTWQIHGITSVFDVFGWYGRFRQSESEYHSLADLPGKFPQKLFHQHEWPFHVPLSSSSSIPQNTSFRQHKPSRHIHSEHLARNYRWICCHLKTHTALSLGYFLHGTHRCKHRRLLYSEQENIKMLAKCMRKTISPNDRWISSIKIHVGNYRSFCYAPANCSSPSPCHWSFFQLPE